MSRDDPFGLSEDRERTRIRLTGAAPRPMAPLAPGAPVKRARSHPNTLINTFAPVLEFAPELESALAPENPEAMRTRLLDELVRARDAAVG
ncbi:MAG: type VI secretion system protein TssL, partial [Mesorhizobium sp.]